jgi:hypothetical protein
MLGRFRHIRVLVAMCLLSWNSHALEKVEVTFVPASRGVPSDEVKLTFFGRTFDPPLNAITESKIAEQEIKPFYDFLRKIFVANSTGTKLAILGVWSPGEHAQVEKQMTATALESNRARFQSLTGFKLKMIVKYGAYHILFVQNEFQGQSFVMKFPVKHVRGSLYLTNELNGDYFYDNISQYLDRSNYKPQR